MAARFRDRWEPEFLRNELWACWVLTGMLVILSEIILGPDQLDDYLGSNRFAVFPAMVGVEGALLGLVIAASALVLDRLAEGRLALVQQSRHVGDLTAIFKSAMVALGGATVAAVLALTPTTCAAVDRAIVYVWALLTLLAIARLGRVIWIVGYMLDIVTHEKSTEEE
jgi:hypothetical protein